MEEVAEVLLSLDDVSVHTQDIVSTIPDDLQELRSEVLLRRFDGSEEAARIHAAIPNISAAYLKVVSGWRLLGLAIGRFTLYPEGERSAKLHVLLDHANSNRASRFMGGWTGEDLFEVGSHEADPICVASRISPIFPEDSVWLVPHNLPSSPWFVGGDFTQFLVLAGNLSDVRLNVMPRLGLETALSDFLGRVRHIASDPNIFQTWQALAQAELAG